MSIIDTHCHLDILEKFGIPKPEALSLARSSGINAILQVATDLHSSRGNIEMANDFNSSQSDLPTLYWTVGLHPGSSDQSSEMTEILDLIEENHTDPYFTGVGETGLDYYHLAAPPEVQQQLFEEQLAQATRFNLPVILHLRDSQQHQKGQTKAVTDALSIIDNFPALRGVLHCFTYGYEEAKPFVDRGWFVSYSGVVTFNNAQTVQEGAVRLPLDVLLVETDAPFLTPNPQRGQTNQPAYVEHVLNFMAALREKKLGEDPAEIKKTIFENSLRFLNWKKENA